MFNNIKAIAFDVGNTLVKSNTSIKDSIFDHINKSKTVDPEQFNSDFKTFTENIFKRAYQREFVTIKELHLQRLKALYEKYGLSLLPQEGLNKIYQSLSSCDLYKDASILLKVIKTKYRLALLSNADEDDPAIRKLLDQGFPFELLITSESAGAYKPNPGIFMELTKRLHLDKDETLYIGDDLLYDVKGGKEFGLKVVWVNRKNEQLSGDIPEPDLVINDLVELLDYL